MTAAQETAPATGARRNEKVGQVVSTKMQKTIVVEVEIEGPSQVQADHAHHQEVLRA